MLIDVRVKTNCPTASIEKFGNGLKIRVKAKPIGGKANAEVVGLVANYLRKQKTTPSGAG